MKAVTRFSIGQAIFLQYTLLLVLLLFMQETIWTLGNVMLSVGAYYVYMGVGVSLMLHRYFSHRSVGFRNRATRALFTYIACISGRGSPVAWAYVHRLHHRYADREGDPHAPGEGLRLMSFSDANIKSFSPRLVLDLLNNTWLRATHDYYLLVVLSWPALLLYFGGFEVVYFGWVLPLVVFQLVQDVWNYYGHKPESGYRLYQTQDNSQNVPWLYPFILGEAWHHSHHANPANAETGSFYEPDPVYWFYLFMKKIGL